MEIIRIGNTDIVSGKNGSGKTSYLKGLITAAASGTGADRLAVLDSYGHFKDVAEKHSNVLLLTPDDQIPEIEDRNYTQVIIFDIEHPIATFSTEGGQLISAFFETAETDKSLSLAMNQGAAFYPHWERFKALENERKYISLAVGDVELYTSNERKIA